MENILGYSDLAKVHHDIEDQLKKTESGKRRGLFLLPRGHLKSTEITISYVLQRLVRDPNERVLITNALLDNSKGFLRELKGHMERNERFRSLFGNLVNENEKWSETQIVLKNRTKFHKEPTVQVTSVDKSVVSQHYSIIIADDVQNRENSSTKEQRDKLKKYYRDLLDLLEPDGTLIVVGTRWHYDDIYGWLISENRKSEVYDVMVRKVWSSEGIPLFPKKFTPDYIRSLKAEKGSYEFNCQYNNEVVNADDAEIDRNCLVYYDSEKLNPTDGGIYITVDPALSKTEASDFTGIVVNLVLDGKWNIIEARKAKLNPTELVDEIFYLKRKYANRLIKIGVEDIMYTSALDYDITRKMKETNDWFLVEKIKHRNRAKVDRIRALIPLFERRNIELDPTRCMDLVEEIEQFPSGQHDDVLDALAYQLDIVKAETNFTSQSGTKGNMNRIKPFYTPVLPRY